MTEHRDHVAKHYVYRCYDRNDVLLYVGCTMDVEGRMQVHASSWHNPASAYLTLHMTRYEAEGPFAGKIAGRAAERAAIAAERPLLNVHHNGENGLKRSVLAQVTAADVDTINSLRTAMFEQAFRPGGAA